MEFKDRLTVIVPAYSEAETLSDTLRSLPRQTLPPAQIVVIDDCSSDETAEIANSFGVDVLRTPENTGSKAGAQTFSSSCFSIYRTAVLRAIGGWSSRTMAEDVDLTWTLYAADRKVRFMPEAVCFSSTCTTSISSASSCDAGRTVHCRM